MEEQIIELIKHIQDYEKHALKNTESKTPWISERGVGQYTTCVNILMHANIIFHNNQKIQELINDK